MNMNLVKYLENIFKPATKTENGNENNTIEELPSQDSDGFSVLDEIPAVLESLNEATRQFRETIKEMKESTLRQATSLHEVAVTSEEIVAAAKSISESADSVEKSSVQSLSNCLRGKKTLKNATHDMESLGLRAKSLVNDINELGTQNEQIAGIAEIITEITNQLELLSFNAEIEAVGAGVQGRRFAVVAQEVKRLADNSKGATTHIQNIIKKILKSVSLLVESAYKATQSTSQSLEQMNKVVEDIQRIYTEVSMTSSIAKEIKISTRQQTSAQQELSNSLTELDSLMTENTEYISKQAGNAVTNLSDLAQYLTLILEETVLKSSGDNIGPNEENLQRLPAIIR